MQAGGSGKASKKVMELEVRRPRRWQITYDTNVTPAFTLAVQS